MTRTSIKLSFIIVAYQNPTILKRCLDSIPAHPQWEVIVIDNTLDNIGFAAGCNLGAKKAQGEYLFFLNPDCIVNLQAVNSLLSYLKNHPEVGLLAPALTNEAQKPYPSCSLQPKASTAWIVYSILGNLLKAMPQISHHWQVAPITLNAALKHPLASPLNFWQASASPQEVGIVSGAAFLIKRSDYIYLGGMDEHFFLYWEEVDLARRILQMGKKVVYFPQASVIHSGGLSTPSAIFAQKNFNHSRRYFFNKHFGVITGRLTCQFLEFFELGWLSIVLIFSFSIFFFIFILILST